jgi:hypothetical protein
LKYGHYTAIVQNPLSKGDWVLFNDARFKQVEKPFAGENTIILIFRQRQHHTETGFNDTSLTLKRKNDREICRAVIELENKRISQRLKKKQ